MQYYIDSYNDMHAALVLRQMFEAGEITQETYTGGYAAAGDALDVLHIHELHKAASVLNGRLSGLSQKSLLKFSLILSELMKTSPVMISIFSDQSQRDEVENAVKVIDTWALMPGDGNTKAMEDVLLSQRLSCGAKVYLYCYLTAASSRVESVMYNGEKYAPAYYIESRLDGWFTEALFELLLENNTPKENAAGQTYGF